MALLCRLKTSVIQLVNWVKSAWILRVLLTCGGKPQPLSEEQKERMTRSRFSHHWRNGVNTGSPCVHLPQTERNPRGSLFPQQTPVPTPAGDPGEYMYSPGWYTVC